MYAQQVYTDDPDNASRPGEAKATVKPFTRQGHFTMVDNAIIDFVLPRLSGNEVKLLLYVLRKTRGWGKEEDAIPYSQIMVGTGIRSRSTVHKAVERLESKGYILVSRAKDRLGRQMPSTLSLNRSLEVEIPPAEKPSPEAEGYGPKTGLGAVRKLDSGRVQKLDRHEESTTEQFGISGEDAESRGGRESVVEGRVGRNTSTTEKKSGFKISGIGGEEAAERVTAFRRDDPLGEDVYRLIQEAASHNKSGEMAASRAYNSFIAEVLYQRERGVSDEAWRCGIQEAIRRDATNSINYARAVAVNRWEEESKKGIPAMREAPGTSAPKERAMPEETPEAARRKHEVAEAATEACGYNPRGLFRVCRAVEEGGTLTLVHRDPEEAAFIAEEFAAVLSDHDVRVVGLPEYREEKR